MPDRTLPAMPQAKSTVTDLDEIARDIDIIDATVGAVAPERIVLWIRRYNQGEAHQAASPLICSSLSRSRTAAAFSNSRSLA